MIGSRLSHFEITARLGAGGMGEVYRARDTKLDREVAIKVLPEAFTSDPDRLARFEREARVLASLNHPNIAAIHGLEDADGVQALVLELVEGPTLADRIAEGPIPLEEALPIARQIAEALEAAHEQGIIHRDLKPANVKVRSDGTVKVLDFGLAKALQPAPGPDDPSVSQSPTITAGATELGAILGTAAYMAPEQARGQAVDRRADIWAFGCVLYEMLTGRRPFRGNGVTDTLAAVLRGAPDWSSLPADTPSAIQRLLSRSLEKEPRRRLPDIGVARLEIDEALAPSSAEDSGRNRRSLPADTRLVPWVLALLSVIAAAVAVWMARKSAAPPSSVRVVIALPADQQLTLGDEGAVNPIALSPDGRDLVYTATPRGSETTRLFLRPLDRFEARPIEGTDGAQAPFFSADGQWIGFFTDDTIEKVSVSGGPPVKICDTNLLFPSASWGLDDTIVFTHGTFGLYQVPASGGDPVPLTSPDGNRGEYRHFAPQILPGGRDVLFSVASSNGFLTAVLSRDSGEWRELLDDAEGARYVKAGYLVYAQYGSLLAVPLQVSELEFRGRPLPVLERVPHLAGLGAAHFAVSDTGTLAYPPPDAGTSRTTLVWVDREGRATPISKEPQTFGFPAVSPDGERIAVTATPDIWVYDVGRGTRTRLTTDGYNLEPVWSSSGDRLAYSSARAEPAAFFDLHSLPADGATDPELLLAREGRQFPYSWPDDGIVFSEMSPSGTDVGILQDGRVTPLLAGPANERSPVFSPNRRWMAYVSDESGQDEVYVTRYPEPAGFRTVSVNGGRDPVWSPDGRELFYRRGNSVMVVPVDEDSADRLLVVGAPRMLFEGQFHPRDGYDVTPDGQRFVMLQLQEVAPSHVNVVLNWFDELERLAPVNR